MALLSTLRAKVLPAKSTVSPQQLRVWNIWLALLFGLQALAILLLSMTHVLPVHVSFFALNPMASEAAGNPVLALATQRLFDVNIAYLVAAVLLAAAAVHAVLAGFYSDQYAAGVKKAVSWARWIHFGLSGGLLVVLVALLAGVGDVALLLALLVSVVLMAAVKLAIEVFGLVKAKSVWLLYGIGCKLGMLAVVAVGLSLWGAAAYNGTTPGYLYGVFGTLVAYFAAVAVNNWLYYKKVSSWKDYAHSERVYLIVSFVALSAVAWQVYAGLLRP